MGGKDCQASTSNLLSLELTEKREGWVNTARTKPWIANKYKKP